ncbi:hypothetical protein [Gloeocapsopsis dulcis]|uniref:Uncharacterized protein n=1 Tax=Gloeocapsopsis dulcis AAB1 = 1H9 TaxID=1433147 RepID=A0A6N8FYU0_9CHRO|nr:hypothetical protein [Gloeocapsopsis dulcis]MUL37505.1 hypothetical protein [Gloeocapsopsis dulcis AAB1 = 1H9]WNN89474.1 hypothetical protein P0S91_25120 [Gloeocapsopsis dulcis]
MKVGDIEFIAFIAFAVTAVGYFLYVCNRSGQQLTHTEENKKYAANFSGSLIQKINQQFLILVVTAEKASLIQSLKEKKRIDPKDGKELYGITKYLWSGSESAFNQRKSNIRDYLLSPSEESEYDIYLVYLKLKESDAGFKPDVNQLARYDAFRKLADLTVNFEISPRLQMEAYRNFELYSR